MAKTNRSPILWGNNRLPVEFAELGDGELVVAAKAHIAYMNEAEAVGAIKEIFHRSARRGNLLADEVLVGKLFAAALRKPHFGLRVIDQACPPDTRERLRARVILDFVEHFDLATYKTVFLNCKFILLKLPALIQTVLVRLVLFEREDLFFFTVFDLDGFDFNFTFEHCGSWVTDHSHFTHGPKPHLAQLHHYGLGFRHYILLRGTPAMKAWARRWIR